MTRTAEIIEVLLDYVWELGVTWAEWLHDVLVAFGVLEP